MSTAASRTGSRQTTPLPPLHVRFARELSRFPRTGAISVKVSIAEHPLSLSGGALVPSLRPPWPTCDRQPADGCHRRLTTASAACRPVAGSTGWGADAWQEGWAEDL